MIVVVDYGIGNISSIINMVKKAGGNAVYTSDKDEILQADKLILVGVGSFDTGMKNIDELDLKPILHQKVINEKTPILGICLGMQLMTKRSEEGKLLGLGWIDARSYKFPVDKKLKVPHMGWNTIKFHRDSFLFREMEGNPRFYFVHSYYVKCNDPEDILTTTEYGLEFVSSFQHDNIIGTQFHPEKSHKWGIKVIKNFLEMDK